MKYLLFSSLFLLNWMNIISPIKMKKIACTLVHTGKFFQYKNQGQFYSTIIRGDSVQMEINA